MPRADQGEALLGKFEIAVQAQQDVNSSLGVLWSRVEWTSIWAGTQLSTDEAKEVAALARAHQSQMISYNLRAIEAILPADVGLEQIFAGSVAVREKRDWSKSLPLIAGDFWDSWSSGLPAVTVIPLFITGCLYMDKRLFGSFFARNNECVHCGYDLSGIPTTICPECGHDSKAD